MKTAIILLFLTAIFSCKKKEVQPTQSCPEIVVPTISYGILNFQALKNCNNVKSFTGGDLYLFKTLKERDNNSAPVYRIKSSLSDTMITIQSQSEDYYYTIYGRTCTNDLITKVGTIKVLTNTTSTLHIIM